MLDVLIPFMSPALLLELAGYPSGICECIDEKEDRVEEGME
jgi:hypothetical protein